MTSLTRFEELLISAANAASEEDQPLERDSFEGLLSRSIRDALDRVNAGSVDSYELGPWVISNLILLADIEGYELRETIDFLQSILD